ncbi:hypothetical protein PLICRDRAFT_35810 [Plicaturopsis crispa FD-325 SS-3]|nr:hypothetical protein PLICRDRAFT_35810 [Plicaturopsis crispa FD-325 SS-3]
MTAIQAIYIRAHDQRTTPKPHIAYRIEIQAHVRSWQMWRRYSEFVDLHTELTKSTGAPPPAALPPKHALSSLSSFLPGSTAKDEALLEERRQGLEAYLRAILAARDERWRECYAFKAFIGVPSDRSGPSTSSSSSNPSRTSFTLTTWLDEHHSLQSALREVRALLAKRDALSTASDVAGAHTANVAAKKRLAGALTRVGRLGAGLHALGLEGLPEGELQRRTDMVGRLQDDCETLGRMATVARQTSRGAAGGAPQPCAPDSDKAALLGGAGAGGWPKPAKRVFGAQKPQETEATRPLDDAGVFQLQQTTMETQDAQLSQLSTILARQRHLGVAIAEEIGVQNEMLDGLGEEVDRFGGKLAGAKKLMNRLG